MMTELSELVKIRKLLTWLVRQKMLEVQRSEFKEKDVTDVVK